MKQLCQLVAYVKQEFPLLIQQMDEYVPLQALTHQNLASVICERFFTLVEPVLEEYIKFKSLDLLAIPQDFIGRELLVQMWVACLWRYCKLGVDFDADLVKQLSKTQIDTMPEGVLSQLPYSIFYIPLEKQQFRLQNEVFLLDGVLVTYLGDALIMNFICTPGQRLFAIPTINYYDNELIVDLRKQVYQSNHIYHNLEKWGFFQNRSFQHYLSTQIDYQQPVIQLVWGMVLYLASINRDVVVDPVPIPVMVKTKRQWKFFSQKTPVIAKAGHRIGRALREFEQDKEWIIKYWNNEGRYKLTPHWRRAHFHYVRFGEKRSMVKLRWYAESLVNKDMLDALVPVIHTVKKS